MIRRGPRITAIGGGTGLSTMLRGLKTTGADLTAIVTVTDDGGGSGILRRELGMLPPGDIRSCILALANAEPRLEQLVNYRFSEGSLAGQSLGNLFLAALNDLCPSFDRAVTAMSEVLAITGRVLPVSNDNITLRAHFNDGRTLEGETHITDYKKSTEALIEKMELVPGTVTALPAVLQAIDETELLIMGPGSLYTSVLPNLLIPEVSAHIARSRALRIYVCNIMTQDGETERYSASDHVRTLFEQSGSKLFDWVLCNSAELPGEALGPYRGENAAPVVIDEQELNNLGVRVVYAPVASVDRHLVRHNPTTLSAALMNFYRTNAITRVV